MPKTEPFLVVYFGMLSYRILSEHATEDEAREELTKHVAAASGPERYPVRGYTRDAHASDFDVRTQSQLDALTAAIHSTR